NRDGKIEKYAVNQFAITQSKDSRVQIVLEQVPNINTRQAGYDRCDLKQGTQQEKTDVCKRYIAQSIANVSPYQPLPGCATNADLYLTDLRTGIMLPWNAIIHNYD